MKNILSVTSCLKRCSVAISYHDHIYEINENIDSAANLAWLSNELIKSNNIDLKQLDGVITSSGPGSFTGIRVAQSFAKGIALSLNLPATSVDYFDVINNIYSSTNANHTNKLIIIKSDKSQAYFKVMNNEKVSTGISSYEDLEKKSNIQDNFVLLSDIEFDNIPKLKERAQTSEIISDFKRAVYLLDFANHITQESSINPLYINAKS